MHDLGSPACGAKPLSPKPVPPSVSLLREDLAFLHGCRDWSQRLNEAWSRLNWLIDAHESRTAPVGCGTVVLDVSPEIKAMYETVRADRSVDDALDAAGAPHHDERGSLTTAQRVAWLADQRNKWRACTTRADEVNQHGPNMADASAYTRSLTERTEQQLAQMVESVKKPLHAEIAELKRQLAAAMSSYERLWADAQQDPRCADRARLLAAEKQGARLREAMGLLTTLAPRVVVGGDRDPVEMAREIHAYVTEHFSKHLATELDKLKVAVQPERDRPHPHGQLSNESTTDFAIRLLHELRDVRDAKRGDGFRGELQALLNRYSMENGSDTPDYVLEEFLTNALAAFDRGVRQREQHRGRQAGASRVVR